KDLRWTLIPLLADVMSHGTAPSARDSQLLSLLGEWDGRRLDANGDGKIDEPGATIMDGWWPKLAVAGVLAFHAALTYELAQLAPISIDSNFEGNCYHEDLHSYLTRGLSE